MHRIKSQIVQQSLEHDMNEFHPFPTPIDRTYFPKIRLILSFHWTLSIHNKLILYKQILKPVWTYGIQLWGCTKQSNTDIIQRFQNKVLRNIVNAP